MMKLKTLREKHVRERRALLREALEAGGWTYAGAAELLECPVSTAQMIVRRDDVLRAEYEKKAARAGMGGPST